MLEDNVFRMIMFICAIIIVALLINILMVNFEEIEVIINSFFINKVPKY